MSVSSFPYGTVAVSGTESVAPTVSAQANGRSNNTVGTCYVGVKFDTDGEEYEMTASGSYGSTEGTWLDTGNSEDVWVEFIRTGGTESAWSGKSNSTRYQISSDQIFSFNHSLPGTNKTIIGYFKFYDAASGGNTLDTTSGATWAAFVEIV